MGAVLLDILVVLVAAKVAAELAERMGFPGVVAEILAGVVVGPSVLGFVGTDEVLAVLGELGVILLLLQVGFEMDLDELGAVGRSALSVATIGVLAPMATGFGAMTVLGYDTNTALFLGAALAATSVGITARVFSDLRALATVEARTVLGAAVADDVMGLVVLTVVVRIVSEGTISVASLAEIIGVALVFLVVAAVVGSRAGPPLFSWLHRQSRSAGTVVALALAFTLAFAELAHAAKLAPIVGAFVAGLALSRSEVKERITRELTPIGHLLVPVFFLQIGIAVEVEQFASLEVLGIAAVLLVCAIGGKLLAATGALGSPGDKWVIGFGMLPRGEVGLIFATIGQQAGVLGDDLYAALLLVVLITTLMAPPLLRWRIGRTGAGRVAAPVTPMPEGGWLRVDDGLVELTACPPVHLALSLGLEAAHALGAPDRRPGSELLDWLGSLGDVSLRWEPEATQRLFSVLVDGSPRTWRFLETTGLLERALPELAEAVARRRADPFVLEPSHVLRFALVEQVRTVTQTDPVLAARVAELEHPEWLLLAALILEAAGDDGPVPIARRLVRRLDLGAAAEQDIALLLDDTDLLLAAARRIDGLDEEQVIALATHLAQPERTVALHGLTVALGGFESWERARLDELVRLVLAALEHPELTGREARNLLERRRNEARALLGDSAAAIARLDQAPRGYLLAGQPADLARQVELIEPLPSAREARVAVTPLEGADARAGAWRVEVVLRDRPGLLATVSGVLAESGLDVLDADVATWADGAALESFRVRLARGPAPSDPDGTVLDGRVPRPDRLEERIVAALDRPLEAGPNPDAEVVFDAAASPWYTLCEVRCPDRPGLLHSIAVGLWEARADVHSARLGTEDGRAVDRFELTDRHGRKLPAEQEQAIVEAIRGGVRPGGGRRRLLRRA